MFLAIADDCTYNKKLAKAYETLKDEKKRRYYDSLYNEFKSKATARAANAPPQWSGTTKAKPKPDEADISEEIASITAIYKAKAERAATWAKNRREYDDTIFELKREIRKLQAATRAFEQKEKAERDEEKAKNSWTRWILNPIYGKPVETEEEKRKKDKARIDRLHSMRFKERELARKDEELRMWEERLRVKEKEKEAGDQKDDINRSALEGRVYQKKEKARREKERLEKEAIERLHRERMEKERVERVAREKAQKELQEKLWREWQERDAEVKRRRKEADEAKRRKGQEEMEEIERIYRIMREQRTFEGFQDEIPREEAARSFGRPMHKTKSDQASPINTGFTSCTRSSCLHEGWWDKIEGRSTCERCAVSHHGYLLQCPGCKMKACASCQQLLRPRKSNMNRRKTDQAWHH
jgi:hypothetical protein